jgi:hypothetical protein
MLFELRDYTTSDSCGIVKVVSMDKENPPREEINESWEEFNKYEEHEKSFDDVDEFVEWSNRNRITQIERVHFQILQPI